MEKNDDNAKALVVLVTIVLLTIAAVIAKIIIGLIHLARFTFWIFLILIPISLVACIIFFVRGLWDNNWNREDDWIVSGFCLLFIFLFFFLARGAYSWGYSEEAIKTELEIKGYLQWYGQLMSIFDIPEQITDQAVQETIDSMCKDPNYPCDNVKKTFQTYKDIRGMKDTADKFSGLLFLNK
ncbi:MAG: hypothetical protein AABX25_02465 [Nanoarchaeota archaeon]